MLRRSLLLAAVLLTTTATGVHAQTTAGMSLSVTIFRSLAVYAMNPLDFGQVGSSNQSQTISKEPTFTGSGFQIVGELNRTVAVSCPATATLSDGTGGTITFTPRFSLFTPQGQQSTYVRGTGGCPSIQLGNSGGEGQSYLAFGGDLEIPQFYAGTFSGTYTISVAYP